MTDDIENLRTVMEGNEWRAALIGLCTGSSTNMLTPFKAAAVVRNRIAFAVASGKLPLRYTFRELAEVMADSYNAAAVADGFEGVGDEGDQRDLHVKWMLAAINSLATHPDKETIK